MLPERIASKSIKCNPVIEAVDSTCPSKRIDIPTSNTSIFWVIIIRSLASDMFKLGRTEEKSYRLEFVLRCLSRKKIESQIQVGKQYWSLHYN